MHPNVNHAAVEFRELDVQKFRKGFQSNRKYWSRFKEVPHLHNAAVLDVGSGWGTLCIEAALAGARRVVGVDINASRVNFANAYLQQYYPHLTQTVTFEAVDLQDYDDRPVFDYILAKDSFEHILDLRGMLSEMKKRLKPGGRIYTGFGPLYTSPYGDHDRRRSNLRHWGLFGRFVASLPWAHLLTEQQIIAMYNRYHDDEAKSMRDLGLNTFSASEYQRIFRESGLTIVDLKPNQSENPWSKVFSALARIPALEDYVTHNIYAVLEKPLSATPST